MPFSEYIDPDELQGTTDILRLLNGTEELLIVVGNETTITSERDIVLERPHLMRRAMLPKTFKFAKEKPKDLDLNMNGISLECSWDLTELRLEKILHHFKKRRAEVRESLMEDGKFIPHI